PHRQGLPVVQHQQSEAIGQHHHYRDRLHGVREEETAGHCFLAMPQAGPNRGQSPPMMRSYGHRRISSLLMTISGFSFAYFFVFYVIPAQAKI
ncbi:MAG: hypothetical protein NTY66_03435, partial [Candidatus Vogelbacteria bacterium]|nr:hypothetical protein [Candidatus Vogelbacteria bacterium]